MRVSSAFYRIPISVRKSRAGTTPRAVDLLKFIVYLFSSRWSRFFSIPDLPTSGCYGIILAGGKLVSHSSFCWWFMCLAFKRYFICRVFDHSSPYSLAFYYYILHWVIFLHDVIVVTCCDFWCRFGAKVCPRFIRFHLGRGVWIWWVRCAVMVFARRCSFVGGAHPCL